MTIKKGLMSSAEAEIQEEARQMQLRSAYGIDDENIVVVEKKSMGKFLIRLLVGAVKTVAAILFILLCAVGAIAFVYPDVRTELLKVLFRIFSDALHMLGV